MDALTEREVRASFVNASRGEVTRLRLPDLGAVDWDGLDYLGWVDERAPMQAYLVAPGETGPVGMQVRRNRGGGFARARMCSLCVTTHSGSGVSLMVAPRAGRAGREGNSVGLDICADLQCSGYVRGTVPLPTLSRIHETISVEDKVARLRLNLAAFVARVTSPVRA